MTTDDVICQGVLVEVRMLEHEDRRMELPKGIFPLHEGRVL